MASSTVRKTAWSLLVVLLGILLHFFGQPYKSSGLDKMHAMVIMSEFFTLFSGLIFLPDKMSPSFLTAMEVVNIIIVLLALSVLIMYIVYEIAPKQASKAVTLEGVVLEDTETNRQAETFVLSLMGNTLHRQAEEAKKNLIGVQRLVKEVCGNIDASDSSVAKGKARSTTIRFKGKRNKSCFGRFIPALALMCALSLISSAFAATPFPDTSALRTAVTNCLAKVPSGENCCSRLDDPADCGVAGTTDMPGWNTAGVTSMDSMFFFAGAFNQNIGAWDVSADTSHAPMFWLKAPASPNIQSMRVTALVSHPAMAWLNAFALKNIYLISVTARVSQPDMSWLNAVAW